MLKILLRMFVYVIIIVVIVGGIGLIGTINSQNGFWASVREEPLPSLKELEQSKYDPSKPTVAVILGNENTEGLDFTIPYQLFSMTDKYNVFAVASDKEVKTLTGGIDVVPHYSFEEIDKLLGKSADIIAIPYMTMKKEESFQPIHDWILKHKDTTLLSICAGSDMLASTGLLDGKLGATHWQTMPVLTKKYPKVNWANNQRYVVNNGGKMISSAGISSGIDASLYIISQQLGEQIAEKIAKDINYPTYHFVQNPKVDPFYLDLGFSTYVLNNAYHWNKNNNGALLYNGVEEMALASVFDIYYDTGTTRVQSIALSNKPIVTKNGLNIIPRNTLYNVGKLDKLIIPGVDAKNFASKEVNFLKKARKDIEPLFVHANSQNRFIFEVQLEDLAMQEDLLTAKHALKRLEFRGDDIDLEGKPFPIKTYVAILITFIIAIITAFYVDQRFLMKKKLSCCIHRK